MTEENDLQISLLANSPYYFLQHALIIKNNDTFRLIVINGKRLRYDQHYNSLRGAKIAFARAFKYRNWKETKPGWSHFYTPAPGWLGDIMSIVSKGFEIVDGEDGAEKAPLIFP